MERQWLEKQFEKMGARITIRKGTSPRGAVLRMNVSVDRGGEHFTLTIHPDVDDSEIQLQVLDYDPKLKQMLLFVRSPRMVSERTPISSRVSSVRQVRSSNKNDMTTERLLVGRDEMHWFVAGVTVSNNIREAFRLLRPQAVTVSAEKSGVKTKEWRKRKTKGFVRQGEWFFVPIHFQENKDTIIHKNEPITRPTGGKPHYVEEVVRKGGETVYMSGDILITEKEYKQLPNNERYKYAQRTRGAIVLGRGKVKHPDHHTINLVGWHEVHLSTESGTNSNAFID
jgi:hypothetical protein